MIGQEIGNYKVVSRIGAGGMGEVFEATHQQLGRRAAIKRLHPQHSNDPESLQRFFNEARAVNIVQHPSLVNIFEFGRLDDGAAYIIMEYLEGETLRSRFRKSGGRLDTSCLPILRQVASALAATHQKGIIHRVLMSSSAASSRSDPLVREVLVLLEVARGAIPLHARTAALEYHPWQEHDCTPSHPSCHRQRRQPTRAPWRADARRPRQAR